MTLTANVEVKGVDEVVELLNALPEHLFKEARKQVAKSTINTQTVILEPLSFGTDGLQSRTGALARSIRTSITGTQLKDIRGRVFTDVIYAPIHEKGGTVTAKNAYKSLPGGPFLNIPADANKTPAGIMRETAKVVFNTGGFIVKIKAAKAKYAVIKNGRVMFWLVKSVTIKATLGMVKAAEDEVPTLLSNLNKVLLDGLE